MTAERVACLLADNGKDRLVIQQRIVEPGDQMRSAWPRGRDTYAQLSREFCVGRSHKGRHFLMPCLNELNLSFRAVQRAKDAVDAIARVTKNMSDIPSVQTLNEKIAYCLRHRDLQAYWHRSVECSQPDPTSEGSNRLVFRFRASEGLLRNKGPSKAVGDLTCRRK